MIFIGLIYNLSLLIALSVVSSFVSFKWKQKITNEIVQGLIFGSTALIAMLQPLTLGPGLIFDGRSVVISLCGLFYGPIAALIAAIMALILRIYQGGLGVYMGTSVIAASAIIGIIFYYKWKENKDDISIVKLWLFSVLVHLVMLALTTLLPNEIILPTLSKIGIPVIVAYPLASLLISKIIINHFSKLKYTQNLQEREKRLNEAQKIAHLGSWEVNISNGKTNWSDETFDILGVKDNKITPSFFKFKELIHPKDYNLFENSYNESLTVFFKNFQIEARINETNKIDFKNVLIKWENIKDENNNHTRTIGTIQDITELKKTENFLRESEAKIRTLLQSIPDLIWLKDQKGVYLGCNNQFELLFGAVEKDIVGKTDYDFVDKETADLFRAHDLNAINKGEPSTNEEWITYASDGKRVLLETIKTPMFDRDGTLIGVLGIGRNITARKLIEKELIEKNNEYVALNEEYITINEELQENNKNLLLLNKQIAENEELQRNIKIAETTAKLKQEFLANMSHEIRTPLSGIIGMTEILYKTLLDDIQKDYVDTIKISSESLLSIINDILDLSKIEAGKMELRTNTVDIDVFKNKIKGTYDSLAKERSLYFDITIENDVPKFFLGDEKRILQIITNLLSNAVKFTKEGFIRINFSKTNQINNVIELKVSITDSGIGIKKDDQLKLFTKFSQVDSSLSRSYDGTGLGLAICKEFVNIMQGEINVISEEGKGSTFWFTFKTTIPVFDNSESTIIEANQISNTLNSRILLVEDKIVNQKVVTIMLQNIGCSVSIANNGLEALFMFEENKFDIILMDVQMPEMDGITATKNLKSKYTNLPPIIGLSANAMEGDAEKFIAQGFDDYLSKPVTIEQLQDKILKYINK